MTKYTGLRRIDQLLDRAKETVNDCGNRVRHLLLPGDRFLFDFNLDLGVWEQFDTENDASYFGGLGEQDRAPAPQLRRGRRVPDALCGRRHL